MSQPVGNRHGWGLEQGFDHADQKSIQKPVVRNKCADADPNQEPPQGHEEQAFEEATQKGHYQYWLQQQDIADIERLEYRYGIEGEKTLFDIVDSSQQLSNQLEQSQTKVSQSSETRPLTLIVNLGNTHWVTLVIVYQSGQFYGYYVDSLGHKMPNDIHQALATVQITPMNFHSYLPTPQQIDGHNCGLWALENAADLNRMLQEKQPLDWAFIQLKRQRDETHFKERRKYFAEKLREDETRAVRKGADRRPSSEENALDIQAKKTHLPSELRQAPSNQQSVKLLPEIGLPVQQPRHHLQQGKSKIPRPVKIAHQNNQNKRPPIEGNEPDDVLPDKKVLKVDLPDEKDNYAASGLKSSLHGAVCQLKLLLLFLKRGLNEYKRSFRLATEMDAAEKFVDVVFQYSKDSKLYYRFLQAKHKQDKNQKITLSDLLTDKEDEFSLPNYFNSYRRIQSKPEFKSGTWEDFTICTNIDFDFDDQTESRYLYSKKLAKEDLYFEKIIGSDDILNVGVERYRFVSDHYKEKRNQIISKLKPLFEKTSDLKRLAKLLAEYVLIKKDKKGNSKTLGLNEALFKTYQGALAEEVIDIHNKKFHDDFLTAHQKLSPHAKLFRDAFREAVEVCLKSRGNLSTQNEKILQTLSSESPSKIPKFYHAQPMDKENDFWQAIKKIELNLSDHFGKILKIESNPQLTGAKQLAEEIARLLEISKRKSQVVVKIIRNKPVIVGNIDKLAGYVWVKKDEKLHFSTAFLNKDQPLSGHLRDFRDHLNTALIKKGVNFDTLDQYQFNIANFQTCQEEELQEHLNSKPTLPNDSVISNREIEDFLNKLVFAVNQPNEGKLGEIINKEIGKEFNLIDADLITNDFQKKMWDWMKEKQGKYLSESKASAFFEDGKEKIAKKILVFDFGGGTLDVVVLSIERGVIDIKAVGGDTHLGGDDIDYKLVDFCLKDFTTKTQIKINRNSEDGENALRRLTTECEKRKRQLCSKNSVQIIVDHFYNNEDLICELTREKFEQLNNELFVKSTDLVSQVLNEANLRHLDIDDVVLVGGTTRIPKIQEMLTDLFDGKSLNHSVNPDEAVAIGAAIQAAIINGNLARGEDLLRVSDVIPISLSVKDKDGFMSVIIPRNSKVPNKYTKQIETTTDNQAKVEIEIYEGEETIAVHNRKLAHYTISNIPPGPSGQQQIEVNFMINDEGILHVNANIMSNGEEKDLSAD